MADRFTCSECAAEFATESEMLRHVSEPHKRAGTGRMERMATPPRGETSGEVPARKTREYSRRNPE